MHCFPQRYLVELASKVHEHVREARFAATAFEFDWQDRQVRLGVAVAVWVGPVA
jgi:hypothetical protein